MTCYSFRFLFVSKDLKILGFTKFIHILKECDHVFHPLLWFWTVQTGHVSLDNLLCSLAKSCPTLWSHGLQHTRLPCPSLSPRVCSNSCPLSWWCHPTISFSAAPFSPALSQHQFFYVELALPIRWPKYWSLSFSISPFNEYQGWFPLGLTGLISV